MNRRVLIVDASLTVRMALVEAFGRTELEAVPCRSLHSARAAMAEAPVEAVVVGNGLAAQAGAVALRELLGEVQPGPLLVVSIAGEHEREAAERAVAEVPVACIACSEPADNLATEVGDLLNRRRRVVLVIDDSRTFREHLGELLEGAGYRTVLAESGEAGLRQARKLRPDAVVVDGVMPSMSGTATIRALRLDPNLRTTSCLLLTASEGVDQEIQALDAGADAYVRKTEDTDIVLARLAAILRSADHGGGLPTSRAAVGPGRILAVDDSLTFLSELEAQLESEGYVVTPVQSGEQALAQLKRSDYDCVLLDVVMTGISGVETCRAIKEDPALRALPIVMLTAETDPHTMIEAINAGADDFVEKSSDFSVLQARLRATLRRRRVEEERRRVREQIVQKEAEARAATTLAETRSQLLREVERKNEELSFLNRELQMFAHSVSHDLSQPLRGIEGFTEILLEQYADGLDDRGRHYLERVYAGAKRMGKLVEGLLGISRVSRREVRRERIDLSPIATRVAQRLVEGDPGRVVALEVAPQMPAWADVDLIESVFENLLGNAWKFTARQSDARVVVGVDLAERGRTYFVRDNGVGFDMSHVNRIFGPFQRLHAEKDFSGSGIGLAIVQRIVHRHGGDIWAESSPGRGATFLFTLDAPDEDSRPAPEVAKKKDIQ